MRYLYLILVIAIAVLWYGDRTSLYYSGLEAGIQKCYKEQTEQQERDKKRYEQEKEAAIKEALNAAEHISSLTKDKAKIIEHTRTIVVPKPADCDLSASELYDYNH